MRKPSPKAGNGNVDGAKFKRIFCRSAVNKNKTSWMRRKSYDFTHTQRASSPGLACWAFSLELRLSQSASVCLSVLRRDVGNRQASEQRRGRADRPADIQCMCGWRQRRKPIRQSHSTSASRSDAEYYLENWELQC